MEEAAAKVFAQGMQASGILTSDKVLTPAQREQLRSSLGSFMGSKNAGKIMVAEAGLKYQGITMNPEASQMLESRSFSIEEMCRWFRVPPFMVGHMDKQSSWASSVEAQNLHFLTNSLRPLLVNIEQEITRCLIGEVDADEYFAEFAVEGLLRADSAGRGAWYNTALQNGWMCRNEVRRLENMAPIPGGDTFTVQSALVPLDQLGKQSAGMSPAAAAFMLRITAANQSGDKEAIKEAFDLATKALDAGKPRWANDGPCTDILYLGFSPLDPGVTNDPKDHSGGAGGSAARAGSLRPDAEGLGAVEIHRSRRQARTTTPSRFTTQLGLIGGLARA